MAPRLRPQPLYCYIFINFPQLSSSFINPTDSAPPYNTLLNMSTQGQGQGITFAPACIAPFIVDTEFKLRYLREGLKDKSLQFQRKNIEFLIHYYENGGKVPAPGQIMWLLDGKVIDKRPEKVPKGSAIYPEEVCLPLTLTYYYLYLYILRPCAIKLIAIISYCKSLPSDYCNSQKCCGGSSTALTTPTSWPQKGTILKSDDLSSSLLHMLCCGEPRHNKKLCKWRSRYPLG
jgi:hypothetical protein